MVCFVSLADAAATTTTTTETTAAGARPGPGPAAAVGAAVAASKLPGPAPGPPPSPSPGAGPGTGTGTGPGSRATPARPDGLRVVATRHARRSGDGGTPAVAVVARRPLSPASDTGAGVHLARRSGRRPLLFLLGRVDLEDVGVVAEAADGGDAAVATDGGGLETHGAAARVAADVVLLAHARLHSDECLSAKRESVFPHFHQFLVFLRI